ncbi:MAG: hypothetical protein COW47_02365 [Candidatus Huberarchaeum crystalense]|uniref:DUF106 domain-containing protein n=1 Tax=Huberarchaeum crystalense TaxID=2014257 RepID=A0A2G9LJ25_HUBC1|nr:hypothetical protein [archaeon]OIP20378.1 MAG: hypothetical protein AUJ91_01340 [archaeon CG2_30_31_98]PIN66558.1 MAG: hypothetical protein COW69_01505 [Candidatus Huberarchaeum crystalense]NCS98529.1 hypothetical protein [archaeon]PIV46541.1 MAG: hypothetical protein COS22_00645 [Candidatus Huberarchaeum crystalense]
MSIISSFDAFIYILVLVLILEAITLVLQYFLVDFEGVQKAKKEIKALQEKAKQASSKKQTEISKQVLMSTFSMMKYQKQYLIASFILFPLFFFLLQNPVFMSIFSSILTLNVDSIRQVICSGEGCIRGPVLFIFGVSLSWFWTYILLFMAASIIGSKLFLKY